MSKGGKREGAGRPLGSKNKLTQHKEVFEDRGFNPLIELIELYQSSTDITTRERIDVLKELTRYCYPKPKPYDNSDMTDKYSEQVMMMDFIKNNIIDS